MAAEAILIWIIIGAIAGFLAGVIVKGYGFGLVGNIVIGIVGAFLASVLFPRIGLFTGADVVGQIIAATLGAVILLVLIGVLRRA
jgi:uncharacterized membrane protein YeaQ/YmgE (transglycosylase-associated protein family)